MNKPAAIQATFADYRRVRGRKVGQLIFELPLEQLHEAISSLGGEPSVEQDTWVAIARLAQAQTAEPIKWKPEHINTAQEAALTCQKPNFWRFLRDEMAFDCTDEPEAAGFVRAFCRVNSRADIAGNGKALERWHFLLSAFFAWMAGAAP